MEVKNGLCEGLIVEGSVLELRTHGGVERGLVRIVGMKVSHRGEKLRQVVTRRPVGVRVDRIFKEHVKQKEIGFTIRRRG